MELIDTHAHIYSVDFEEDRAKIIEESAGSGITQILMPAIDSKTHEAMLACEATFDNCLPMMGLHPCSVTENAKEELLIVKDWLDKRAFIAVGEIGLDFYWDRSFEKMQYEAFHYQIKLAATHKLPIVIHSRNATRECIDVVKKYPGIQGVFHCFSGSIEEAEEIISLGLYLGIGGVVTFKNGGLDKVIAQVGLKNLLLETDAPYLAPVPYRGKRNQPGYLSFVVEKIGSITNYSSKEVAAITSINAKSLFGLA